MNSKDINAAQHMVAHCERIERYLNICGNSLEQFMNNELVQDGVTMQLLAMGELTTHFSEEFKERFSAEIDWRNLKQLRNVCAHRYGTLDYKIIWNIAAVELVPIKEFFKSVIQSELTE